MFVCFVRLFLTLGSEDKTPGVTGFVGLGFCCVFPHLDLVYTHLNTGLFY